LSLYINSPTKKELGTHINNGTKLSDKFPISIVNIKFSLLNIKSYIFLALIIKSCATKETIVPTIAEITNKARLSLSLLCLFF